LFRPENSKDLMERNRFATQMDATLLEFRTIQTEALIIKQEELSKELIFIGKK
jgi:hypothetical protein